ncbi:MAG: hypothetical protein RL701_5044, partial [Pseudomonadota bacterium]
ATRWPDAVDGAAWDYGTNLDYLKELVAYWQHDFDWRALERQLNTWPHFKVAIDGFGLHFLHVRGRGDGRTKPVPLLLSHGFPDSFLRMVKLIPLLTDPAAHGGDAADAFDVVIPSLPGFGFSDRPKQRGWDVAKIAALLHKLMTETLGYTRYAAHGGDWGSAITEQLAVTQPEQLLGIHLTEIPFTRLFSVPPANLSAAEQAYVQAGRKWQRNEGGYFAIQSTKPQTLAAGLADSPVGLAAWIVEKYRGWSDCDGDVERAFTKDELLANITLYWVTQTIHSAMRLYYEARVSRPVPHPKRVAVKTAVSIFPKDLVQAPREYGERFYDIQRWTVQPRGGHFAAFEEPELMAHDLREFFRNLR